VDCRHVCKTCAFHDALQAEKQKEVHPLYSPDLAPACVRSGECAQSNSHTTLKFGLSYIKLVTLIEKCSTRCWKIYHLTLNDVYRRRAVNRLKLKIPSKNMREKSTNTPIIHSVS
jgi:hypothetical protein